MARELSQYAGSARILWRFLESKGIDPAPLYAEADIHSKLLNQSKVRVKAHQMDRVWARAIELLDDPCFGVDLPQFWRPGDLQLLDHAWLASPNLLTALGLMVRYLEVLDQSAGLRLERTPEGFALCGMPVRGGWKDYPQVHTGFMALMVHLARLAAGDDLVPVTVSLRDPEPCCSGRYQSWFRCPIHYAEPEYKVVFHTRDLTRSLSMHAELSGAVEQVIIKEVSRLRSGAGITGQVHALIIDGLPEAKVAIDDIAAALLITPRELQRRLQRADTSYRAELDKVRRTLVSRYLKDTSLSLIEISFLLGFSEQSAFSRACKRWFGKPPSQLR